MSGEARIAGVVMDWLQAQGWDCYPEVEPARGGPRADIVGVRGNLVMVCEVKTSMGLALLSQAIGWHGTAHFICVATPVKQGRYERTRAEDHVFKYYGLGRLSVFDRGSEWEDRVKEKVRPSYLRPNKHLVERMRNCLCPDMKRYSPGTQVGYSTPWNRTMTRAVKYIESNPGCTIKELMGVVETHYASPAGARAGLREWLPEDKRVRVDTGARPFRYYPAGLDHG